LQFLCEGNVGHVKLNLLRTNRFMYLRRLSECPKIASIVRTCTVWSAAIVTIKSAKFGGHRGDAWHLAVASFQKSVSAKESQGSN
jgi:hypothetical protein